MARPNRFQEENPKLMMSITKKGKTKGQKVKLESLKQEWAVSLRDFGNGHPDTMAAWAAYKDEDDFGE